MFIVAIYIHYIFKNMPKSKVLSGQIDDVCTTAEELHSINSKIHSDLNKLRESVFFRIFKVNLEKECKFWKTEGVCISNKCMVDECDDTEVPSQFKMCNQTFDVERNLQNSEMSMINSFLPNTHVDEWMEIEENDEQALFVNLMKNSHSWTFFNGSHLWKAIYQENCMALFDHDKCQESHVLYKLISGVQANVDFHITHHDYDLHGEPLPPNHEKYLKRVGFHKDRLENFVFTYSLTLKAIEKLGEKIDEFSYLSENPQVDNDVKETMKNLIQDSINICENPFKEDNLLTQWTKEQFISTIKPVFYNITKIIDCIPCEKCKLYGKLQFTGLTAVMKIMFGQGQESRLTRNEMVGLINLMAKLADSMDWYHQWIEYENSYEYKLIQIAFCNPLLLMLIFALIFLSSLKSFNPDQPPKKSGIPPNKLKTS
ncbi:unnamed protein product [Moneuplotes crassus]|uniref:Uncharacterized protein n=1 Tax=Euplotes crassus TaxID=5936 RepID=A0AAD1UID4_EUPCR|nr:unnamed protein product [Moneuplotes crassus]